MGKGKVDGSRRKKRIGINDTIECPWERKVVQETVQSEVEEESTNDRVVKVETVARRVVYTRSCSTTSSPSSTFNLTPTVSNKRSLTQYPTVKPTQFPSNKPTQFPSNEPSLSKFPTVKP